MPLVYAEDGNTTQDRRTKSKKEAGSTDTKNGRYKLSTEENLVSSFFITTDILNL